MDEFHYFSTCLPISMNFHYVPIRAPQISMGKSSTSKNLPYLKLTTAKLESNGLMFTTLPNSASFI